MVRKLNLQPSLPGLLAGLQRQAGQGIARASSSLTVQTGEAAPAGESIIPVRDVLTELTGVSTAVAAAEQELADAGARLATVQALAQEAFDVADDALGAIGTKAQVLYGTGMPPSTTVGEATYYRLNAEGAVIAAYRLTSPWQGAEQPAEWAEVDFHESMMVGKIATSRLEASEVAAAVGVFIDAMMQHLTVTGVANIEALVADELFAKLAVVDKLQALTSVITQDMIATGAVTAEKIAANAINAAMVDVGLDARWDSTGLHFYLPVGAGQDPEAWEQRQRLISLAPAGDIEVNVADGQGITAGLVGASGKVWGKTIEAGELILAGKRFVPVDGPRGSLGLTRAGNNTSVNNTNRRVMGVRAPLFKGRMYEFRYNLGLSRSAGDVQVQTFLEYGTTTVQIGQFSAVADGDFTAAVIFDSDKYGFTDGQDVMVVCYLRTTTSGATGTLWSNPTHKPAGSWVHLIDHGPAVSIYTQALSNPTNSKRTYTQRFWQTGGKQFRGDGGSLQSSDSRWIVGGRVFGADNPDQLWFRFNFDPLIGSTIKSASLTIKCTQTYQSGQTSFLDIGYSGSWDTPGSVPGHTTFQAGHGFTAGQTRSFGISGGAASGLASGGFKSIVLKPTYPGSTNSYMYMDTGLVYVDVTYEK